MLTLYTLTLCVWLQVSFYFNRPENLGDRNNSELSSWSTRSSPFVCRARTFLTFLGSLNPGPPLNIHPPYRLTSEQLGAVSGPHKTSLFGEAVKIMRGPHYTSESRLDISTRARPTRGAAAVEASYSRTRCLWQEIPKSVFQWILDAQRYNFDRVFKWCLKHGEEGSCVPILTDRTRGTLLASETERYEYMENKDAESPKKLTSSRSYPTFQSSTGLVSASPIL